MTRRTSKRRNSKHLRSNTAGSYRSLYASAVQDARRREIPAEARPWRVRDKATRARYYFNTREEASTFVDSVCTSEITGEWLRSWEKRLVIEPNK